MEPLVLYGRLVGAQLRGQMQYRVSFLLALTGSFVINIAEFGGLLVLFTRVPTIAGWSLAEVALLYGLSSTAFALAELVAAALDEFQVHILQGTFDRVLVRPRGTLFQVLTADFALRRAGRVGQGLLVLLLAARMVAIRWSPDKVAVLVGTLVCGIVIYFSIFVLGAAFCFWTTQGKEASHVLTYGGDALASYPLDIYRGWLRRFFTFVVPLAFVNYQPALYLLDRPDPLGLPPITRLLSPLAALIMVGVAWCGWRLGVRRYQSTGW